MTDPLFYIVDNDLISVFDIKIRLHQSPYECRTRYFHDTETAFGMLSGDYRHIDGVPDIVLVNFDLEGMDGLSFLEKLSRNELLSQRIHVYVFSVYGVPDYIKKMKNRPFIKGYLTKPLCNRDIKRIFENLSGQGGGGKRRSLAI